MLSATRPIAVLLGLAAAGGAVGCARPPEPTPVVPGSEVDWASGDRIVLESALPVRVHGQAVGVQQVFVGYGPEVLRLDPVEAQVASLQVTTTAIAQVLDLALADQDEQVLVATAIDVREVVWSAQGFLEPVDVADVRAGAYVAGEGAVVYADGTGTCRVRFIETDQDYTFDVACPPQVHVAAVRDQLWVALGQGGLWRADPAGVARVSPVADRVSYDDVAEQVVILDLSERLLTALDPAGESLWTLRAPVRDVVALPGRGLIWAEQRSLGTELVLATVDGEERERLAFDPPVEGLSAAPDGSRLGVRREADYATYQILP